MRYIKAAIAFALIFFAVFALAGWFILPHVPPTPDRPVSVVEGAYWLPNWPGYIAGAVLGTLSARSTLRTKPNSKAKSKHEPKPAPTTP